MGPDRLQLQRLELKYRIEEPQARAIRTFVQSYLELDEYGAGKPGLSYPIHSLYLDSDTLTTYWETINGNKNRFKMRLRYYDDEPASPVFFEIKRRSNDAILKQRGGVRREAVAWLLAGHMPEPSHMLSPEARHLVAVQRFSHLITSLRARPKAHVTYYREAWVSTQDNSIRVTMDRNVRVAPEFGSDLTTEVTNYVKPFGRNVILELKFTGRFPNWFQTLVEAFDLARSSAAKYAEGVELIGEDRFYRGAAAGDPPQAASGGPEEESGMDTQGGFGVKMAR